MFNRVALLPPGPQGMPLKKGALFPKAGVLRTACPTPHHRWKLRFAVVGPIHGFLVKGRVPGTWSVASTKPQGGIH